MTKKLKILIVDDEAQILELIKLYLEMEGHTVLYTDGGHEAFKLVEANKDIDLVLSDVRMAKGDGVELLEKVKELNPRLPQIILMTGFAKINKNEAKDLGALDLMEKPLDFELLESHISKITASLS